jgi:hypothetical protein
MYVRFFFISIWYKSVVERVQVGEVMTAAQSQISRAE